jgi:chorismate mutase
MDFFFSGRRDSDVHCQNACTLGLLAFKDMRLMAALFSDLQLKLVRVLGKASIEEGVSAKKVGKSLAPMTKGSISQVDGEEESLVSSLLGHQKKATDEHEKAALQQQRKMMKANEARLGEMGELRMLMVDHQLELRECKQKLKKMKLLNDKLRHNGSGLTRFRAAGVKVIEMLKKKKERTGVMNIVGNLVDVKKELDKSERELEAAMKERARLADFMSRMKSDMKSSIQDLERDKSELERKIGQLLSPKNIKAHQKHLANCMIRKHIQKWKLKKRVKNLLQLIYVMGKQLFKCSEK